VTGNLTVTAAPGTNIGTITLNGATSYDPQGLPLTYQWNGGESSGVTSTLSEPPGTYLMSLQVINGLGLSSIQTVTVTVKPDLTLSLSSIIPENHYSPTNYYVQVVANLVNTTTTPATNVTVTSATLLGYGDILVVPNQPFTLAPGKTVPLTLIFLAGYPAGTTGTLLINGNSSLGTFSLQQSVTVP
jgi:hypothetical protein